MVGRGSDWWGSARVVGAGRAGGVEARAAGRLAGASVCSAGNRLGGAGFGGLGTFMAEGLDPIEAGKQLHEHGGKRADVGGGAEHGGKRADDGGSNEHGQQGHAEDRHTRILQISEALLLALVTITAAWAGYSAARWNTVSRVDIARSATLRNVATRDLLTGISLRNFDSATFNAWFIAFTLNKPEKEAIAIRRFRPAFRVAFNAWLKTDPEHNPHAPPGPTYMPQYKQPALAQGNALDAAATRKFNSGNRDGQVGDNYVRITVFLAAVLFLVGISSSFKLAGVRYALVVFGSVLLVLSIVLLASQPGLPR